jgi:hypothetical protein
MIMRTLTNIVESVTPLYESILDRTKDKLSKVSSTIKNMRYLGGMYRPESISLGMKSNDGIGVLNLSRLEELNKGKDMMSDTTIFDCGDERMLELVKYLENMDISELGFPAFDCSAPNHIYYDLIEAMWDKMKQDGIFKRPDTVRVSSFQPSNKPNEFWVNIRKKSKPSGICVIFKKINT